MAIYGTVQTCADQVGDRPHFAAAFQFLAHVLDGTHAAAHTLAALPEGQAHRVDLAGPGGHDAYALLQHSLTKPRAAQQAEAHNHYADVQAVIDGDELLEVMPRQDLEITQRYNAERDVALFHMPEVASKLIMRPGLAAVLFPNDAHAPLQAPDDRPRPSRRIVVKVRVAE